MDVIRHFWNKYKVKEAKTKKVKKSSIKIKL